MPGDFDVLVSNGFGTVTSAVAKLKVNRATADSLDLGPIMSQVSALALQTDGKILVGGSFITLGGRTAPRWGG